MTQRVIDVLDYGMAKQRCLVTGGAGFIASHLVDLLIAEGHAVTILDDLSTGRRENLNPAAKFREASILDLETIKPIIADCDWVFHAAAWPRIQPSFDDPLTHEAINVNGTINCLLAARDSGIKRFLYFGSSAVYGTPDEIPTTEEARIRCYNPYALHKFAGEQYAIMLGARWGIPAISLRLFNVYGARSYNQGQPNSAYSPVIGIFHHMSQTEQPLTVTGQGDQSRDFVHVHDVARAFLLAAQSNISGEILNVGSGQSDSIDTIARLMSDNVTYIPERPNEARITHADISKTKRLIGWEPSISLEQGLTLLD